MLWQLGKFDINGTLYNCIKVEFFWMLCLVLKRYSLMCLRLKCHDICKLLPNGLAKKCIYIYVCVCVCVCVCMCVYIYILYIIYIYTKRERKTYVEKQMMYLHEWCLLAFLKSWNFIKFFKNCEENNVWSYKAYR